IGQGGAIAVNKADMIVNNSTISGNTATAAGGGLSNITSGTPTGSVTLTDTTVSGNEADAAGGIAVRSGPLTITGGAIENNRALTTDGGGIAHSGDALSITGTAIRDNFAEQNGGGIAVEPTSGTPATSLENVTLEGNDSNSGGGAAFVKGAT